MEICNSLHPMVPLQKPKCCYVRDAGEVVVLNATLAPGAHKCVRGLWGGLWGGRGGNFHPSYLELNIGIARK